MAKQNTPPTQAALIFIPDISGFTRFISETEVTHSKHIIEELLEILLDANELGLQVSEIEGDAILYYRFGQAPTAAELLAQVQKMFIRFHAHLRKYETHRICHCGACKSAHQLSLKFIAHYGPIAQNQVKQYSKLFGKEVIVAHRLLKNDIRHHEYAMFTSPLVKACSNWVEVPAVAWADVEHGEQEYDSGPVQYCFLPLAPLMDYVPQPRPEDYRIAGPTTHVMRSEALIPAPLEMVFDVVADLPWRAKWVVGSLPDVQGLNHTIFQEGATHRCLADGPVIVAHDINLQQDSITFSETDEGKTFCVVYTLRREGPGSTRMEAEAFMKRNFFKSLFFHLFVKKKLLAIFSHTWQNLSQYCLGLLSQGNKHPYQIIPGAPAQKQAAA